MLKFIFGLALLVSVTSCLSIKPVVFSGPNANTAYSMRCSGGGRTLDDCYVKAGELCPKGFTVVGQATGTIAAPFKDSIVAAPNTIWL